MKQKLFLFAIIMMTPAFMQKAFAYDYYDFSAIAQNGQRLYYNIYGSELMVTCPNSSSQPYANHTKPEGNLIIPTTVTYNGTTYTVTTIGAHAFDDCDGLISATIPNTITTIYSQAFAYCTGLTSVIIGNSVTNIYTSAFSHCSGLTAVTIPNSVITIYDFAFKDCTGLTSLIIGESVTTIGKSAFNNCSGLASVTIPSSVTSIGNAAFANCIGLTSVTIPSYVTTIGEAAFNGCSGLTSIVVDNNNTIYDSRNSCNAIIETATNKLISGCMNTIIPNTVTSIGDRAFQNCNSLTSITIPSSVITIGARTFQNCSELMEINCLGTIAPTLGENAFNNVPSSIPVNIPCGSLGSYYSAWSSYFSNFVEYGVFDINCNSSNEIQGTVLVLIEPTCLDPTAVIKAVANTGCRFDHWSDGSTDNPYTFPVFSDTTLTAYFVSTTGIGDNAIDGIKVYAADGRIVVEGTKDETVQVYNMLGQSVSNHSLPIGVYLVEVGNSPARKVVVIR